MVISELVTFNHNVHAMVQQLDHRVAAVEQENTQLRSMLADGTSDQRLDRQSTPAGRGPAKQRIDKDGRSRSPSSTTRLYRDRDDVAPRDDGSAKPDSGSARKGKGRTQLQIQIPGKTSGLSTLNGLPTPLSRTAVSILCALVHSRHSS